MTSPDHVKSKWPKSLASGLISVNPPLSPVEREHLEHNKGRALGPRRKYTPRARKTE